MTRRSGRAGRRGPGGTVVGWRRGLERARAAVLAMGRSLLRGCDSRRSGCPSGRGTRVPGTPVRTPYLRTPVRSQGPLRTGVCTRAAPAVELRTPVRTTAGGPMADVVLTPRQREILEVIARYHTERGFPPPDRHCNRLNSSHHCVLC